MHPHAQMQTILMQQKLSERENKGQWFYRDFIHNKFVPENWPFSSMIRLFFVGQWRMNDTPRNDGWNDFTDVQPTG